MLPAGLLFDIGFVFSVVVHFDSIGRDCLLPSSSDFLLQGVCFGLTAPVDRRPHPCVLGSWSGYYHHRPPESVVTLTWKRMYVLSRYSSPVFLFRLFSDYGMVGIVRKGFDFGLRPDYPGCLSL